MHDRGIIVRIELEDLIKIKIKADWSIYADQRIKELTENIKRLEKIICDLKQEGNVK